MNQNYLTYEEYQEYIRDVGNDPAKYERVTLGAIKVRLQVIEHDLDAACQCAVCAGAEAIRSTYK